jgi:4'-phosphopantetheinyl transferase
MNGLDPIPRFVLRPVMWRVPAEIRNHPPRGRAPLLSRFAREAVLASARRSGLDFFSSENLEKTDRGVPLPVQDWHWSLSHKTEFAAGVVAPFPVGIDLELPGPRHPGLFDKVGTEAEWKCLGGRDWPRFFRLWTAKESVLKALGVGLAGLGDCRLAFADGDRLELQAGGRPWTVATVAKEKFVAAATLGDAAISWEFRDSE